MADSNLLQGGPFDTLAALTAPSNANAGGPYSGTVNTPISITATVDQGTGANYSQQWTANLAGTFADDTALSTTFTPTTVSSGYILTFTATNDEGSDADTASLVSAAVEIYTGTGDSDLNSGLLGVGAGTFVELSAIFTGNGDSTLNSGMLGEGTGTFTGSTDLFTGTGESTLISSLTGAGTGIFGFPSAYEGAGNSFLNSLLVSESAGTFFSPVFSGSGEYFLISSLTGAGQGTFLAPPSFAGVGESDLNSNFLSEGLGTFSPTGQPDTGMYIGSTPITSVFAGSTEIQEIWVNGKKVYSI